MTDTCCMSRPTGGLAIMTFCVGIKLEHGLVALADAQIVKGGERLGEGKLALVQHRAQQLFIMTSGLRSVRDKAVIYLEEKLAEAGADFQRLYQVAQAFGEQLRRTRQEDGAALAEGGLSSICMRLSAGSSTVIQSPHCSTFIRKAIGSKRPRIHRTLFSAARCMASRFWTGC